MVSIGFIIYFFGESILLMFKPSLYKSKDSFLGLPFWTALHPKENESRISAFGRGINQSITNVTLSVGEGQKSTMMKSLGEFIKVFQKIQDSMNGITDMINMVKNFVLDAVDKLRNRLQLTMATLVSLLLRMKNLTKRMAATMRVMAYSAQHMDMTLRTYERTVFGDMTDIIKNSGAKLADHVLKLQCFHPTSYLEMENGSYCNINLLKEGDILKGGNKITGMILIWDCNDTQFYKINKSYLTGDHRVFVDSKWHPASDIGKPTKLEGSYLICPITDSHQIQLGDTIATDWDEVDDIDWDWDDRWDFQGENAIGCKYTNYGLEILKKHTQDQIWKERLKLDEILQLRSNVRSSSRKNSV